jgi:hypothetical protein
MELFTRLSALVGQQDDSPSFRALLQELSEPYEITHQIGDSSFYELDKFGLSFYFERKVLVSIFFHVESAAVLSGDTVPYSGDLPSEIHRNDLRPTVERKMGAKPESSVVRGACSAQSGKQDYWDRYVQDNLEMTFIFDSVHERIRSFSVSLPQRRPVAEAYPPSIEITIDRFTDRGTIVLLTAQDEARRLKHKAVGTEQILIGLLAEKGGLASKCLRASGLNPDLMRKEIESLTGYGTEPWSVKLLFTPRARQVLNASWQIAKDFGDPYVDTEHLLLALLDGGMGGALKVLNKLGIDLLSLRQAILSGKST